MSAIELVRKRLVALLAALMLVAGIGAVAPVPAQASSSLPGQWSCGNDVECQYVDRNGTPYTSTWLLWNNKWYYFGVDGWMYYGDENVYAFEIDGAIYIFDTSGAMVTGWYQLELAGKPLWMYTDPNGKLVMSQWRNISGKWYYFDDDGVMLSSQTFDLDGETYRFTSSGAMVTGWYHDGQYWYYHGTSGAMYKAQWLKSEGKWYYFRGDGSMVTSGEFALTLEKINGKYYGFDSSGALITGWYPFIHDGLSLWAYFDPDGGLAESDWRFLNGNWYYFDNDGVMLFNGAYEIADQTYRFDIAGRMITGWYYTGATWNYYKANGAMAKGEWIKDGGKWYAFRSNGAMIAVVCGQLSDVNTDPIYCFDPHGAMITNQWVYEEECWFYLGSSGATVSGWQYLNGKWYYFNPSNHNAMVADTRFEIGDTYYVFDASGAWTGESGPAYLLH
ncbi:MAG: N-acetylmuramoyl-L-alanine amidase family protein [Actinomycetaceae bacterium]|nr:N-acetylmuramoyl-L-alanine amidase family protein [Actinomycetaceae bacterium]